MVIFNVFFKKIFDTKIKKIYGVNIIFFYLSEENIFEVGWLENLKYWYNMYLGKEKFGFNIEEFYNKYYGIIVLKFGEFIFE